MLVTVVTEGIHHGFEPAGHLLFRLAVKPELVDQVLAADERHHRRVKAQ